MSWTSVVSVAQLAVSLALILRLLVATADPITQTTDEQIFERTTYIVPFSTTENDSDIGAPTKPENLTSRGINGTTIELSWSEPDNANGVIAGYRVYYMHSNYTDVKMHLPDKSADSDDSYIEFVLKELRPFTEYKIWVKAYTRKNEGEQSDQIILKTDIIGPSAPQILNLTCQSHESVYVHWARPANFWGSIDYYYINYRRDNGRYYEEIELTADKNHLESGAIIPNLTVNTVYEIMVRGATRSTIDSHRIIQGDNSIPTKVLVTRDCDKIPPLMRRSSKDLSAGVIAGMVCACFAVMLAITSFVLWK